MTEPSPPSPTPSPVIVKTKPKKRRAPGTALGVLVLLLIVVVGLVGTSPYWAPPLLPLLPWAQATNDQVAAAPSDLTDRLDALEQKLAAIDGLATRLNALEQRPAPDASSAVAPLQGQLGDVQARLDRDEAMLNRLAKDQTSSGDSAERVQIVALAELGDAIASSGPFAAQLASVEALGQSRPGWAVALKPLEEPAKTGIAGVAVLAQRFSNTVAPAILRAQSVGQTTSMNLVEAMLADLRALVVIRRVDNPAASGRPVDVAVATADAALGHGDLAGAVAALGALDGAPAQAAAPWLKDAQLRLDAEDTVAKLTQQVASDLAAGTSGG
jgi:hypothetical protein